MSILERLIRIPRPSIEHVLAEAHAKTERPAFTGPPIFISGCNRGGTTIASELLAAHPEVRSVGRGPFHEGHWIWRSHFPDDSQHRWAVEPWLSQQRRTAADATPQLAAFFRAAFLAAMPSSGRLLEKTPSNAVRLSLIDALFPDSLFVHVLRDGRHTAASLVARRVPPRDAPFQWVGAHTTALGDLDRLPAHRVVFLRYEALLSDPVSTLGETCKRCGLGWGPREQAAMTAAAARIRTPECRWERFPIREKDEVLNVINDLQRALDYPVEH